MRRPLTEFSELLRTALLRRCFTMPKFEVISPFQPAGSQPEAIARLSEGILRGDRAQTLLGVTGSGKTATMAWTIEQVQKPTLVLCHNKTLAAQLCSEFKEFFPKNAVEYFVSYFDYYQPEAYIPSSDTYIEKDSSINEEIERLTALGDPVAAHSPRHAHRGIGLVHFRLRFAFRLYGNVALAASRSGVRPR